VDLCGNCLFDQVPLASGKFVWIVEIGTIGTNCRYLPGNRRSGELAGSVVRMAAKALQSALNFA